MARFFYKQLSDNAIISTSVSPIFSLTDFLAEVGNVDYVLIDDDTAYNKFQECLKIDNGVLSYDLPLLKEQVHLVRKEKTQELFVPHDKVFEDIEARKVPEIYFDGGYSVAKDTAEAQRLIIRANSEAQKTAINNATTAEAVLALWQELNNNV